MIRRLILGFAMVGLLWSCGNRSKETELQSKVDSLQTELIQSQLAAQKLQEVGILIDSIDASRQLLRTDMVEGVRMNYEERLKDISKYVKETNRKLAELEKTSQLSKTYAATIRKLRDDLNARTEQFEKLQREIEAIRNENRILVKTLSSRDSLIAVHTEALKKGQENIAQLESRILEINEQAKNDQAEAYFERAKALEEAAKRTKFAPRKKKETQREALELYRMALSLGKSEAQAKVEELEKDLG